VVVRNVSMKFISLRHFFKLDELYLALPNFSVTNAKTIIGISDVPRSYKIEIVMS
jgi:hypothetical protein